MPNHDRDPIDMWDQTLIAAVIALVAIFGIVGIIRAIVSNL